MTPNTAARVAARLNRTPWDKLVARYTVAWKRNQTAGTEPDGLRAARISSDIEVARRCGQHPGPGRNR